MERSEKKQKTPEQKQILLHVTSILCEKPTAGMDAEFWLLPSKAPDPEVLNKLFEGRYRIVRQIYFGEKNVVEANMGYYGKFKRDEDDEDCIEFILDCICGGKKIVDAPLDTNVRLVSLFNCYFN